MKRKRAKLVDVDQVGQLLAWDAQDFGFDVDALDLQWIEWDWDALSNATDVAQQKGNSDDEFTRRF
ncbi:MAG: hypothetical protein HY328_00435 [Chloroflexi bacterium]|nr:hypothetical protein [Chloroflexota bacterium]